LEAFKATPGGTANQGRPFNAQDVATTQAWWLVGRNTILKFDLILPQMMWCGV
jgi:hypothetical protein